jgi:hypothetical protein
MIERAGLAILDRDYRFGVRRARMPTARCGRSKQVATPRRMNQMAGSDNQSSLEVELEQIRQRCRNIEAQLAILSEKVGVPYINPSASVPPEVTELARAGKRLDAMKRYRELTNATADEARAVIQGL